MRAAGGAPVDTMGCERCADPSAPPATRRFQTLVSLMLSSQTKDAITYGACQRLLGLPGGFTAANIAATAPAVLEPIIHPVGFYRQKSKFLQAAAEVCARDYKGDIPDTIAGLVQLKGVGPKMAFLAMQCAWDKSVGVGVDTHVHRISNRLRWVKTETPEATRVHLQSWVSGRGMRCSALHRGFHANAPPRPFPYSCRARSGAPSTCCLWGWGRRFARH